MKRLASIIALICLATAQAVWAQPRFGAQGGGNNGRHIEERRGQRQEQRREQFDRRQQQQQQQQQQQGNRNERAERNERNEPGNQRMSPDERRALRDQIRDHGRDIYRDPAKR